MENRVQEIYFSDGPGDKVYIKNAKTHQTIEISNRQQQGNGERAIWADFDGSSRQSFTVRLFSEQFLSESVAFSCEVLVMTPVISSPDIAEGTSTWEVERVSYAGQQEPMVSTLEFASSNSLP